MQRIAEQKLARLKRIAIKTVRPYTEQNKDRHIEFVSRAWPQSRSRKDHRYLRWKFRAETEQAIPNLLLALEAGEVVGQLGLIPAWLNLRGTIIRCQWGCNFKVRPELEGSGYGALLDIRSLDECPVTLGAAPSRQSEEIKIRLGFQLLEGPRVMLYPIDFEYVLRFKLSWPSPFMRLLAHAGVLFKTLHFANYAGNRTSGSTVARGSYRDVIPLIARRREKIKLPHIVHDADYVHWRCQEVPGYRKEAESLRLDDGSFVLYHLSSAYCYIFEYSFSDWGAQKRLLGELLRTATHAGSKGLYVYVNDAAEERDFRRYGFIGFRRKTKIYAYAQDGAVTFTTRMHMDAYDSDGAI
jgi:hypothetical protein